MSRRFARVTLAVLFAAAPALPAPSAHAGDAPFAFGARVIGVEGPGALRVRCTVSAPAESTRVEARLRVRPPLSVASGDSVRAVLAGPAPRSWDVVCRAGAGPFTLEGDAQVVLADGSREVAGWRLEGRTPVDADAVLASRPLYRHRQAGRAWFRADGALLVPVDSTERCLERDIVDRAHPTSSAPLRDALLWQAGGHQTLLRCRVCVDAHGHVIGVQARGGHLLERQAHDQLVRLLRSRWVFAPARTATGTAADCVDEDLQLEAP